MNRLAGAHGTTLETTPSISPAGTAPAPSKAACPARWRWPRTRRAGTWPSPGRPARSVGAACRHSRSKPRPARAGSLFGKRPGHHRNAGRPWSRSPIVSANIPRRRSRTMSPTAMSPITVVPPCRRLPYCCWAAATSFRSTASRARPATAIWE
jgi:hypothetical protein